MPVNPDARRAAEEALARLDVLCDEVCARPYRTKIMADAEAWHRVVDGVIGAMRALRDLLAEPAPPHGSTSTVRSDATPAQPLPTCVNCGSNFISPAPSSAVREVEEAAARLRDDVDSRPRQDLDGAYVSAADVRTLLAALARGGA